MAIIFDFGIVINQEIIKCGEASAVFSVKYLCIYGIALGY